LVHKIAKLPNKFWRWQASILSQHNDRYKAYADPTALTENTIPLMIDWHSGYEEPNPLFPDLHIHSILSYLRDFNLNPAKFNDKDPLKASYIEDFVSPINPEDPQVYHTFLIDVVNNEASKGSICLQSTDPTDPPLIDLKLYESDADITRMALGIQLMRTILAEPAMQEALPGPAIDTLEKLKDYIRQYSSFGHHLSGTAKMGSNNDPMAVVDSKLRVKNCEGLRICDASIFPIMPSYNPSRAVYMVGEVAADIIRTGK
jgi:choline dehydrogenase-like flavoprotein